MGIASCLGDVQYIQEYLCAVAGHYWALVGGIFFAIIGYIGSSAGVDMSTSTLLGIALFILSVMWAQFLAWKDMRSEKETVVKKLDSLLDEYSYALRIESIDHENLHEPRTDGSIRDKKGNLTKRTERRCRLNLKNSINRPLFYKVTNFVVDEVDQMPKLLSTGGVLASLAPTVFFSNDIPAPPVPNSLEIIILSVEIIYGHPDAVPNRKLIKKAQIVIDKNLNSHKLTWLEDSDKAI